MSPRTQKEISPQNEKITGKVNKCCQQIESLDRILSRDFLWLSKCAQTQICSFLLGSRVTIRIYMGDRTASEHQD